MKNDEFIKSYVRMKPLMMDEAPVISSSRRDVTVSRTKESFSFNEVFNDSSQNDHIYERAVSPIMNDLFSGYNACILAYGQTSSGKTYTMKGVNNSLGLIPLSIKEIFRRMFNQKLYAKVSISYFEIYNENIIDLLSQDQLKYLDLRQTKEENGKKKLIVVDLIEREVMDEYQALSLYEKGELKRKFASNNVNFASSRSHTVFKIMLSVVTEDNQLVQSSIYMVDLAGSQSISKTNASGVLKKESENINKSLLALTTVIRSISEKHNYINYRNSKLTRILQPCLCGESKTVVICTVKQTEDCLSESINTLKFGVCANTIKTDVRQNIVDPMETGENARYRSLIEILEEQRNQRARLEEDLMRKSIQCANLNAELQEVKHRLFALENQNMHHTNLIEHYKTEQENERNYKNIFFTKSKESIEMIETENKRLKNKIKGLEETIEMKEKKIENFKKNQRDLLDRSEKYEKELAKLNSMMKKEEEEKQKGRKSMIGAEEGSISLQNKRPQYSENDIVFDIARYRPLPKGEKISSAFTIGTVIDLSTEVLGMKIDMNHYLETIADLHAELDEAHKQIDAYKAKEDAENRAEALESKRSSMRRESEGRSRQDEKKMRKLENKVAQYHKENERLKKKNSHYMKILKKRAKNNISAIEGFNKYLNDNFKNNQKALFEELMQDNAQDYQPYDPKITTEERIKQQKESLEKYNTKNEENKPKQ